MKSRLQSRFAFVIFVSVISVFASASLPPANDRNAPLIMENADHFEGYRSRGEYVLSGKVVFRHGELRIETQRAVWLKDKNIVYCESGMRITQKGALLTADRGTYDKNMGQATATGHVYMRDSSGSVESTGQNLVYLRFRHLATLTGNPEVRRIYTAEDSDSTAAKAKKPADSAAAKRLASAKKPAADSGKPDTLTIRGDLMTYDDSLQVAVSDGNVVIHRNKLNITCRKAEYHDRSDSLFLLGDPNMVMEDNNVKGEVMRLGMHGEEIKSLLVKGAAQAHSVEPATDTTAARQSDVKGDSLFLAFKQKAIDSVQVFRNANGAYFDVDKPDYVNKMSGEYMVLRFVNKQVHSANVLGGSAGVAKSTYFHFEKKRLKGKNEAEGDTIDFAFKNGRVDEVMVKGAAKGTYFGEKAKKGVRADSAAAGAKADSTAVQAPANALAPTAPPKPVAAPAPAHAAPPAPSAKPKRDFHWRN